MRLIDADALKKKFVPIKLYDGVYCKMITEKDLDDAPTVEPKTTVVVLSDDFGNSLTGFYDKGRDMIFTSFGNAPRKWFEKKYKITEANNEQK